MELISQIRANQAEILQRALSKVELAEKHFLADRSGDVSLIVDELTRIASGNPGNLHAADALVASMPKALLEVITQRLGEFQKMYVLNYALKVYDIKKLSFHSGTMLLPTVPKSRGKKLLQVGMQKLIVHWILSTPCWRVEPQLLQGGRDGFLVRGQMQNHSCLKITS